jgi:hypothetical protein
MTYLSNGSTQCIKSRTLSQIYRRKINGNTRTLLQSGVLDVKWQQPTSYSHYDRHKYRRAAIISVAIPRNFKTPITLTTFFKMHVFICVA